MKVDYDSYQKMTSDERAAYHAERDTMTESELLIEKLMAREEQLETRLNVLFADFNNLSIRLEARYDRISDRLGFAVAPLERTIASHGVRLDAQSSSIDSLIERDQQLDTRLDTQSIMIARRGEQFETLDSAIDKRIDDLDVKVADVEFQLEGKVDDLDKEHADRLLALESELEDTTRTANSAEMDAQDAKSDFGALDGQVRKLEGDVSTLQHTVDYG